jgi:hypothetical protein
MRTSAPQISVSLSDERGHSSSDVVDIVAVSVPRGNEQVVPASARAGTSARWSMSGAHPAMHL